MIFTIVGLSCVCLALVGKEILYNYWNMKLRQMEHRALTAPAPETAARAGGNAAAGQPAELWQQEAWGEAQHETGVRTQSETIA